MERPDWWADWIPKTCGNGHELVIGTAQTSFVACTGCPATTDGRGHEVLHCLVEHCGWTTRPPGCVQR